MIRDVDGAELYGAALGGRFVVVLACGRSVGLDVDDAKALRDFLTVAIERTEALS